MQHQQCTTSNERNMAMAADGLPGRNCFSSLLALILCLGFAAAGVAGAQQAPKDMALIPAGTFKMGDSIGDGKFHERPAHNVFVSAFYMDKYTVTKSLWDEVHAWSINKGYDYSAPNPGKGKGANHPVHSINWYDAMKWCNARSEKEGLTPAYYTDAGHTTVYRTGQVDLSNAQVKWDADGYRLPTEAEFEKAQRGGHEGRRFSWGDTITHSNANYVSDEKFPYDVSPTRGPHPLYNVGDLPHTCRVDAFPPNDYGLYDMTGNAQKMCWDWYDPMWYSKPEATQPDPRGPETGKRRMERGNPAYQATADYASCSFRCIPLKDYTYQNIWLSFRCARKAQPVPAGMALVPAGSFTMGNCMTQKDTKDGDFYMNEIPLHEVFVSAFFMDKHEVTKGLWDEVRNWANRNGYDLMEVKGVGTNLAYPAMMMTWYDAVKWCNARSEKEGLTPAYYTDESQKNVYRTGQTDLQASWVKWNANGYRLPTEAEWEKAARGGTPGHRFPWSDTDDIDFTKANYNSSTFWDPAKRGDSDSFSSYDKGSPRGVHPVYKGEPSPVGSFPAYGYGIHDMMGNAWEWCWDWMDHVWYRNKAASEKDTRGPETGKQRCIRGGWYRDDPDGGRVAFRYFYTPNYLGMGYVINAVGFRCVRSQSAESASISQPQTTTAGAATQTAAEGVKTGATDRPRWQKASAKSDSTPQATQAGSLKDSVMTILEINQDEKRLVCQGADGSTTIIPMEGVKIWGASGPLELSSLKAGNRIGVRKVDNVVKAIQLQQPPRERPGASGNNSAQPSAKGNKGKATSVQAPPATTASPGKAPDDDSIESTVAAFNKSQGKGKAGSGNFEADLDAYTKSQRGKIPNIYPDKMPEGIVHGPKGEIKTDPKYPNMVYLPPGTFIQGSLDTEADIYPDERPQRIVTLTRGFWMSKYEVTQGEYLEVMGKNPSFFNGVRHRKSDNSTWDFGVNLKRPADNVLWTNAWEYCRRITERDQKAGKIPTNWVYRLPTEAEWDYAVRAGTNYTRFHYGDDPDYKKLPDYEWVGISKKDMDPVTKVAPTQPVGQKLPNPWGLYDMGGNVWEYMYDIYGPFQGPTMVTDPIRTNAWKHPYRHALKGCGANSPSRWAKSGARGYDPLTDTGILFKQDMPATVSYVEDWDPNGFRVVLSDWHIGFIPYGYQDRDPDGGRQKE